MPCARATDRVGRSQLGIGEVKPQLGSLMEVVGQLSRVVASSAAGQREDQARSAEATAAQSHGEGYDTLSHSRTMYRLPPESLVELTLQLLSPASDALLTLTAQIVKPI